MDHPDPSADRAVDPTDLDTSTRGPSWMVILGVVAVGLIAVAVARYPRTVVNTPDEDERIEKLQRLKQADRPASSEIDDAMKRLAQDPTLHPQIGPDLNAPIPAPNGPAPAPAMKPLDPAGDSNSPS